MIGAAKRKSISPPGLTALWTILLLVVALCLGQTRVWGFEITPQPASGVFAPANPLSIGENYDGWQYDASDSLLAAKGLGNPFKGKTPTQIDEMFKAKGFEPRGPDPLSGKGGYVNPKTGRSYHIDEANSFGEAPHVDVNRLKTYDGPLEKKKYFTGE